MEEGRAKQNLQGPVESVKVPEFETYSVVIFSKTPSEDMSLVIGHGPRLL